MAIGGWIIKWQYSPGDDALFPYFSGDKDGDGWSDTQRTATWFASKEEALQMINWHYPMNDVKAHGFGCRVVKLVKKAKVKQPDDGLTDNDIAFLIESALDDSDRGSAFSTDLFFDCLGKLSWMGLVHVANGLIAGDRYAYAYITSKGRHALLNRFKPVELIGVQSDTCNRPR